MFRLTRYFSVTSLIAFIAVTIVLGSFYRHTAIQDLITLKENSSEVLTKAFAKSVWSEFVDFMIMAPQLDKDELPTHAETTRLHKLVEAQMDGLSVVKAQVYDLNGLMIFSTELENIGQDASSNPSFVMASDGETNSSLFADQMGQDVVTSYMPIQPNGAGTPIEGVFQIYDDVTLLVQQIEQTQQIIVLGVIIILTALYIILYLIVRHGDRMINRERIQREDAQRALKQAHSYLEQQVEERTAELSHTNDKLRIQIAMREEAETHRLEAEKARLILEKQNELAELKENFMVAISHDFRTPLTVAGLSSDILEMYWEKIDNAKRNHHLQLIRAQVHHLDNLLDEIFLVLRAQSGQLEYHPIPLNIMEICRELVERMQTSLGREHQLILEYKEPLPILHADEKLLRFILSNLLSNAIKYSAQDSIVRFNIVEQGHEMIFEISDQGIGIPTEEQAHLFDPYFRGTNVGKVGGTGLGLKIVKDCIEIHQGTIDVESSVGSGTNFTVSLPLLVDMPAR